MSVSTNNLLNMPRLREIADTAQEIMDKCNELQDQLAEYECTYDLPKPEQSEARSAVREAVANTMNEIVSDMRVFENLSERLESEPIPDENESA